MLSSTGVHAQDFAWWAEKHDWDGVTHWSDYLRFSSGYMGPNALPVPELETGLIDTIHRLEISTRTHWSLGDDTQDLHARYKHVFIPGRVAVAVEWTGIERYVTDTITRDERFSRDRDGRGTSTGDLNVATLIRLFPEQERGWGLVLRIDLRTASGDDHRAARHTDAPGYHFDLSTGRWYAMGATSRLRVHATTGFLAYQTNRNDYYQNDCFLFGAGMLLEWKGLRLGTEVAGYAGYLRMKDDPLVLRASVGTHRGRTAHRISIQQGLHDWMWMTVGYTAVFTFRGKQP